MNLQESILKNLDIDYSYRLAKRMEQFRTNPVLGYRPAGSRAEFETGEMLKQEMEAIGLSDVRKDAVKVDGWEFKKAVLSYSGEDGTRHEIQLGAYQTTFVTDGPKEFSLMYLGKGTAADYEGKDVTGKLVLVDINQRDEWWINYPVYQAHLKGAAALIAVQSGGYGEIDDEALNAQDIAGPENAPAFSISRKDSDPLKELLERTAEITITLDADSRVTRDCTTYNIVGSIPGRHPDRMVLLSAHYDSYFSGFQDDNTAIAMMLGIARAYLKIGYQPENTWVFCGMAAEEWGKCDTKYDWSTGAYQEIFKVHPDWAGKVIGNFNFELPALSNGNLDGIRSTYEYRDFLEECVKKLPALTPAYMEGVRVSAPIETWSDDFSVAIGGIPSMVNEFSAGPFMETHYHSQFDSDEFYDEAVYRFHHELYGLLLLELDAQAVVPLNFAEVFEEAAKSLDVIYCQKAGARVTALLELLEKAQELSDEIYDRIWDVNEARLAGEAVELDRVREAEKKLLSVFKMEQDRFVRLNWADEVLFPEEAAQNNLYYIRKAVRSLKRKNLETALEALYEIDNNAYAFQFSRSVYEHFTDYVFHQEPDRLQWGAGRIVHHENLYDLVEGLLEKYRRGETEVREEILRLEAVEKRQQAYLKEDVDYMIKSTEKMLLILQEAKELL